MYYSSGNKKKALGDSTTGVFVSLYLIVLAFFIVMNVISNQVKSKVSASVSSVNDTFKAKYIREADKLEAPTDGRASSPNRDFRQSIENALQFSKLEIDNRHVSRGGSQLRVDINVDDIFLPNSAILNQNTSALLVTLVDLMKDADEDEVREFAFFFGYGDSAFADEKMIKRSLAMKRAGTLARHLQSLKPMAGSFRSGYRKTDETKVTEIMTKRVIVGKPDMQLAEAAKLMFEKKVKKLPIMEKNQLVGIVTLTDIARATCVDEETMKLIEKLSNMHMI